MFVVILGAVKINRAIHSLLDHCLSPTGCSLVTIHIKGAWIIWVDQVNTADPSTGFVQLSNVEDKIKVFDGVGMSQMRDEVWICTWRRLCKISIMERRRRNLLCYLLFTYFIDFISYLSYQIKWYEHKSLWTYFVAYTDYSAKGVLLDWLATICIIINFFIIISFISTITTFE